MLQGVPQAKPNSGPAVAPQAQPGNAAAAMLKVQNAAKLINEALPSVPMGSDFHADLLKVATTLNKILMKVPENPGQQATGLVQQARQLAQQGPAQAALQQMFPQQPPGGAPGAPPGMPGPSQ